MHIARTHLVCFVLCLFLASSATADPIKRSSKLPTTTPWNLDELSKPPAFELIDAKGPVRSLLYDGEPYGGKPTQVFAYYATPGTLAGDPTRDKDLPAVVLIHGGGGTAFREWAELWAKRGYAAIAMDLAGYRPVEGKSAHRRENRTRQPNGGPNQGDQEKFGSVDKPASEQWPYHAVAAVLRAHSLVRSFPEVNVNRTAVTGISWGGYLTCIVAGVDSRFKAAVPVYGCGFLHENSAWLDRFAKMTPQQRERWISLWDPSQYLPAVSMPTLFVNGTNDFAYPLDSYMKSYSAVPGEKSIRVTVNMPHGHQAGWAPQEIGLFVDQHLRGGASLPRLGETTSKNGELKVKADSSLKLVSAALHFTTDTGAINKRKWQTVPARVDGNHITAKAPPSDATAWFITAGDSRQATLSTPVTIHTAK